MKFLAIDFETTGLDPRKNQPLSFCGILDFLGNTVPVEELPRFCCKFVWDEWTIHYKAHRINKELVRRLVEREFDKDKYIQPQDFRHQLRMFLHKNEAWERSRITIAGKNPDFDAGFATALNWTDFEFRMIDPAVLYLRREDTQVPSLATCLERAGLSSEGIHNETLDAEAIIRLIRNYNFS